MITLGSQRELFVDSYLIEALEGTSLKLHTPQQVPVDDRPIDGGYQTVVKDEGLYRRYYRQTVAGDGEQYDGNPNEITCYAESADGIHWTEPELGLYEIQGSRKNNAILAHDPPRSHNFSPMLDTNPDRLPLQKFKALAGTHRDDRGRPAQAPPLKTKDSGLYAFCSEDGIRWIKMSDRPVISADDYAFDSQNVAFWSELEQCYVCYFRSWMIRHGADPEEAARAPWKDFQKYRLRSISRTTSADFLHWTQPVPLNPNEPGEHLYTSQTHPYFRAPQIYIALPTRFMPDRGCSTDIMFMTARGAQKYDRTFKEAFIRPGLEPVRWANRANYAALNVVPLTLDEMAIYVGKYRYSLRTDGFASVHAGHEPGMMRTKPLSFSGHQLYVNFSTSAAGSIAVEIQDNSGTAISGFALSQCRTMVGDAIEQRVEWQHGSDVGALAGAPVRLCFAMQDADLFALRFG